MSEVNKDFGQDYPILMGDEIDRMDVVNLVQMLGMARA